MHILHAVYVPTKKPKEPLKSTATGVMVLIWILICLVKLPLELRGAFVEVLLPKGAHRPSSIRVAEEEDPWVLRFKNRLPKAVVSAPIPPGYQISEVNYNLKCVIIDIVIVFGDTT